MHNLPKFRILAAAFLWLSVLLWTGCGDVFRPVVTPVVTPGGDPQQRESVHVLAQGVAKVSGTCSDGNAPPCRGASSQISVPGDSATLNLQLGRTPVHAVATGSGIFAANNDEDTLSAYFPATSSTVSTITLNPGSKPVFVATGESGTVYVADSGINKVSVVSTSALALVTTIDLSPDGLNPVSIATLPNQSKVYVANRGSGNVSVIQPGSHLVIGTIPVGGEPVWIVANSNSTAVYVLDRTGRVITVDPNTDTVTGTATVGTEPNFMYFDSHLLRLFVTNSGSDSISAFDASSPTLSPLGCGVSGCEIPTQGSAPVSITALSTGNKIYVANSGSNDVSVFNAANLSFLRKVAVGTNPVSIAASSNGTKVYTANHAPTVVGGTVTQQPGTSIIRTSDDTVVNTLPAPFQDPNCTVESDDCRRDQPVWVVGF